jgi:hypothetical protein
VQQFHHVNIGGFLVLPQECGQRETTGRATLPPLETVKSKILYSTVRKQVIPLGILQNRFLLFRALDELTEKWKVETWKRLKATLSGIK